VAKLKVVTSMRRATPVVRDYSASSVSPATPGGRIATWPAAR
jgi:hypothetical protein